MLYSLSFNLNFNLWFDWFIEPSLDFYIIVLDCVAHETIIFYSVTIVWEGMLRRQMRKKLLTWLVKHLSLINSNKYRTISILKSKVSACPWMKFFFFRRKMCQLGHLHSQMLPLAGVVSALPLARLPHLLTLLVSFQFDVCWSVFPKVVFWYCMMSGLTLGCSLTIVAFVN